MELGGSQEYEIHEGLSQGSCGPTPAHGNITCSVFGFVVWFGFYKIKCLVCK